jgi:hypothetical protein
MEESDRQSERKKPFNKDGYQMNQGKPAGALS